MSKLAAIAAGIAALIVCDSPAFSHDSWISKGGYRNSIGEWCCGDNDCESPERLRPTASAGSSMAANSFPTTRRPRVPTARSGSAAVRTRRAGACSVRRRGRER